MPSKVTQVLSHAEHNKINQVVIIAELKKSHTKKVVVKYKVITQQ